MDLITLADLPELDASKRPSTRIAVARLDDKLYDPRYGKFAITQADVDGWKRNLAGTFGGQVSTDFDHSSDRGRGTKASAWITALHQDGALISADVRFTPSGAQAVRDGDYKYFSPAFVDDYKDEHGERHGPALIGGALTNRPVLRKGMPTLSLSRDGLELVELAVSPETRERTATIKGKGKPQFPMPDAEHARLALQFVNESLAKGNITPADAAKIRARANEMLGKKPDKKKSALARDSRGQMDVTQLAKLLSLPEDTDEAAVLAKVTELAAKPVEPAKPEPPEPADGETLTLSTEQVAKLMADANAGAAAAVTLAAERFERAWEKALSEGRAAPSQEETLKELHQKDPELAIKTLDSFVAIVPVKPAGSGEGARAETPAGMDEERFALHTEAKALTAKKLAADPTLDEGAAYSLSVLEIEDRKFQLEHPGI